MDFRSCLKTSVAKAASGIYLSCGAPASARIHGKLMSLEDTRLMPEQVNSIASPAMSTAQNSEFGHRPEMNLAISEDGIGRFRVNIFRQRNRLSLGIRNIKAGRPDWEIPGMQTFDRAVYRLVESGRISLGEVLKNADSPNNPRLNLSLNRTHHRPCLGIMPFR